MIPENRPANSPDPSVVSRDDLYSMVWAEPMETVAGRYGLSGRGLAKICERMKIPRPGRGYWQKKEYGHRVKRPALKSFHGPQSVRLKKRSVVESEDTGPVAEQKRYEAQPDNRITVPERVGRYHPLVRQTRESLGHSRTGSGAARLDVEVDKKSVRRALRILDTLIKALEGRRCPVRVRSDSSKTTVDIEGVEIQIGIRELYERVELPPTSDALRMAEKHEWYDARPQYDRRPTGRLALQILDWEPTGARKVWRDGKRQQLERCLNSFVVGLVKVAEALKELERYREEQRRKWEEQRQRAEARRLAEEAEKARAGQLRADTEAWNQARIMREYLNAYRVSRQKVAEGESALMSDSWLDWAEGYVENLDPLTSSVGADKDVGSARPK